MVLTRGLLGALLVSLLTVPATAQQTSVSVPPHVVVDSCLSGCGSPPATPDNSPFTAGGTNVSLIAAVFDDTLAALTAGQSGAPRMTRWRSVHFNLRDSSNNEVGLSAAPFFVNCVNCGGSTPVLMADATANPTIPQTATFGMLWNTATWDRWRGDTASGAWVNIKNASLPVTGTFWPTTAGSPSSTRLSDGASFYDARAIRALTSADVVDVSDRAARLLGKITFNGTQDINVTNATLAVIQSGAWSVSVSGTVDIGDRAARLLGVVYGSQGQQLQQSAVNFNLFTELRTGGTAYDARSIRPLTSGDTVTIVQPTGTNLHMVCDGGTCSGGTTDTDDGSIAAGQTSSIPLSLGYSFDGTVWRRNSLLALAGANAQAVAIVDAAGAQISSFGGGTQYAHGTTQATPTGTVALGKDPSDVLKALRLTAAGLLNVDPTGANVSLETGGNLAALVLSIATLNTAVTQLHNDLTNYQLQQATNWWGGWPVQSKRPGVPLFAADPSSVVQARTQDANGLGIPSLQGAPIGTEIGLVNRPVISPRIATGSLTAQCLDANIDACGSGSTVEVSVAGYVGAAITFVNANLAGTLKVDWTVNGTHWNSGLLALNTQSGTATTPPAGSKDFQVIVAAGTTFCEISAIPPSGTQKVRLRLGVLTSGASAMNVVVANTNSDVFGLALANAGVGKAIAGAQPAVVGFSDGTTNCTILGLPSQPCVATGYATAKGTQGALGITTQDLHDAGRNLITFTLDGVTPIITTEAVNTLSILKTDAVTTGTTYAVTSGKTLRLTSLHLGWTASAATTTRIRVRLRTNSGGACVVGSNIVGTYEISAPTGTLAAQQGFSQVEIAFPDGLEFSGATRNICVSNIASAATGTLTMTLTGYEY